MPKVSRAKSSPAPVLSAYGMLNTDLQYAFSRSYTASLDQVDLEAERTLTAALEAQGRARLHAQGIPDSAIEVMLSADMRYLDQVYEVNVPIPALSQERSALLHEWADNLDITYLVRGTVAQGADKSLVIRFRSHGVKGVPNAGAYFLNVPYTATFTGDTLKGTWSHEDKSDEIALEGTFQLKRIDE